MGNSSSTKNHSKERIKKNVHWKTAEYPSCPGKPVLANSTDDKPDVITLRWARPQTDGGAPIIGYHVEHKRTGSSHWLRSTSTIIPFPELSLANIEPGWRYQFRVRAENAVGLSRPSEISDTVTVTLQRNTLASPKFLNEIQDKTVVENDKTEFEVSVLGTPELKINWFKDGFEVFSSRRITIKHDNNVSKLIIHQAALTDEGEIKCTATNRLGHAVTRAYLRLEAPPKIRLPRQYEDGLLIQADEVIRIKVGIAGRPLPTVLWSHNGDVIQNGGRYEISSTEKNAYLKIANAVRSDRGEYNVRASNKLSEDNVSFLLTVTAKPSSPGKVIISTITKPVILSWTAPSDDGGCKIGNYIVEYFRVGWNVWLKALTTRQLAATLDDLIEGSEYKFRVKAENPYGLSNPSEESDVLYIPNTKVGLNNLENKESNNNGSNSSLQIKVPSIVFNPKVIEEPDLSKNYPETHSDESLNLKLSQNNSEYQEISEEVSYKSLFNSLKTKTKYNRRLSFDDETFLKVSSFGKINESALQTEERRLPSNNLNMYFSDRSFNDKTFKSSFNKIIEVDQNKTSVPGTGTGTNLEANRSELQEKYDEVHTSNEFVLVLYGDRDKITDKTYDSDQDMMPPSLSFSTPELGVEMPPAPILRRCVSSTELLFEKTMQKLYHAIEQEEAKSAQKNRASGTLAFEPLSKSKTFSGKVDQIDKEDLLENLCDISQNVNIRQTSVEYESDKTNSDGNLKDDYLRQEQCVIEEFIPSSNIDFDDDYTDSTVSSTSSLDSMEYLSGSGTINTNEKSRTVPIFVKTDYSNDDPQYKPTINLDPINIPKPILKNISGQSNINISSAQRILKENKSERESTVSLIRSKLSNLTSNKNNAANPNKDLDFTVDISSRLENDNPNRVVLSESNIYKLDNSMEDKTDNKKTNTKPSKTIDQQTTYKDDNKAIIPETILDAYSNFFERKLHKDYDIIRKNILSYQTKPEEDPEITPHYETSNFKAKKTPDISSNDELSAHKSEKSVEITKNKNQPKSRRKIKNQVKETNNNLNNVKNPSSTLSKNLKTIKTETKGDPMSTARNTQAMPSISESHKLESTMAKPFVKVEQMKFKSKVAYMTDVAMFIIACWVYVFKDAKMAIPILMLMVYRKVENYIKKQNILKSNKL